MPTLQKKKNSQEQMLKIYKALGNISRAQQDFKSFKKNQNCPVQHFKNALT